MPVPTASAPAFSLPSNGSAVYELKKLRGLHHQILRLAATGMKQKDIAKALGVTKPVVGYTINSQLGQKKLKVLMGEADARTIDLMEDLANLAPLAVGVIEDIMLGTGVKDETRLRAAEGVLASQGVGKHSTLTVNHHLTSDDDLAEARRISRQRAIDAGIIVDVAPVQSQGDGAIEDAVFTDADTED